MVWEIHGFHFDRKCMYVCVYVCVSWKGKCVYMHTCSVCAREQLDGGLQETFETRTTVLSYQPNCDICITVDVAAL